MYTRYMQNSGFFEPEFEQPFTYSYQRENYESRIQDQIRNEPQAVETRSEGTDSASRPERENRLRRSARREERRERREQEQARRTEEENLQRQQREQRDRERELKRLRNVATTRKGGLAGGLLSGLDLDTGDILLIVLLFYLYQESGDIEFLLLLGFLFLI